MTEPLPPNAPQPVTIQYIPAPTYLSAVAQSIVVTGPTGDGLAHLHFVRDVVVPKEDFLRKTQTTFASGTAGYSLSPDPDRRPEPELHHQIVASISVPSQTLYAIAKLLIDLARASDVVDPALPKQAVTSES